MCLYFCAQRIKNFFCSSDKEIKKIRFEKAPEPEDIIFENIENLKFIFKSSIKNVLCFFFAFMIIFRLNFLFNALLYNYQKNTNTMGRSSYDLFRGLDDVDDELKYAEYIKTIFS